MLDKLTRLEMGRNSVYAPLVPIKLLSRMSEIFDRFLRSERGLRRDDVLIFEMQYRSR